MSQEELDQADEDLDYVRSKRKTLIEKLEASNDPKEIAILSGLLADMGREALSKKKIKVDKEIGQKGAATAAAILAQLFTNNNIKDISVGEAPPRIVAPILDDNIIDVEVLPGELDVQPSPEDYDAFMKRIGSEG